MSAVNARLPLPTMKGADLSTAVIGGVVAGHQRVPVDGRGRRNPRCYQSRKQANEYAA